MGRKPGAPTSVAAIDASTNTEDSFLQPTAAQLLPATADATTMTDPVATHPVVLPKKTVSTT